MVGAGLAAVTALQQQGGGSGDLVEEGKHVGQFIRSTRRITTWRRHGHDCLRSRGKEESRKWCGWNDSESDVTSFRGRVRVVARLSSIQTKHIKCTSYEQATPFAIGTVRLGTEPRARGGT
ncbi:hypothetical protein PC120_g16747 [Phytophthora cactorum]|nr:hypothetical protein PC120_g16747 [Phytophthora cactorum]